MKKQDSLLLPAEYRFQENQNAIKAVFGSSKLCRSKLKSTWPISLYGIMFGGGVAWAPTMTFISPWTLGGFCGPRQDIYIKQIKVDDVLLRA